jgi:hypothetical protein
MGTYGQGVEALIGDSIAILTSLDCPVDFFIHDSDHSREYEAAAYAAIAPHLSENVVIL